MKVLQFGKFYPPCFGGIERVIEEFTEGLNMYGVSSDVLCANTALRSTHEIKELTKNISYQIFRSASFGKLASTAMSPSLVVLLKRLSQQYDIIHIHHPDPLAALALYIVRPKAKVVLHWHSDIIQQKHLLKMYHPLLLWLINRSDLIIGATNEHLQHSDYREFFGSKSVVIPYALTPKQGETIPNLLEKDKFNIFSVGRLVYYKGFEYLIDCAHYLDECFKISIGGDGALRNVLQKRIINANLEKKVVLLGGVSQNELYSYYQSCDIFVLPSIYRSEMFGLVQLEAMSFKKPVISCNVEKSGIAYVNQHQKSGLLVPPKDSKALARAFLQLYNNSFEYHQLAQGAAQRVQEFLPQNIIPKLIAAYQSILQ